MVNQWQILLDQMFCNLDNQIAHTLLTSRSRPDGYCKDSVLDLIDLCLEQRHLKTVVTQPESASFELALSRSGLVEISGSVTCANAVSL